MAKAPAPFKPPKLLGACADLLYTMDAERRAAQKLVDAMEDRCKQLRNHIIDTLPKSQAGGIAGKIARVTIVPKTVPKVDDWEKFYGYILKTKDFSLLQRRAGAEAIGERWEAGKTVPGVSKFKAITLSVVKV